MDDMTENVTHVMLVTMVVSATRLAENVLPGHAHSPQACVRLIAMMVFGEVTVTRHVIMQVVIHVTSKTANATRARLVYLVNDVRLIAANTARATYLTKSRAANQQVSATKEAVFLVIGTVIAICLVTRTVCKAMMEPGCATLKPENAPLVVKTPGLEIAVTVDAAVDVLISYVTEMEPAPADVLMVRMAILASSRARKLATTTNAAEVLAYVTNVANQ